MEKLNVQSLKNVLVSYISSLSPQRKKPIILGFLYKSLLETCYILFVVPNYAGMGLFLDINLLKYALSSVFLYLIIKLLPEKETFSSKLLSIMLLITTIPQLSFFWLANQSTQYMVYIFASMICLLFISQKLLTYIDDRIQPIRLRLNISQIDILLILILLSFVLTFSFFFITGGIDLRALKFDNVYLVRSEINMNRMETYLFHWLTKSIIPVGYLISLLHKKWRPCVYFFFLQILLYMMTANKGVLLILPILSLIVIFTWEHNWWNSLILLFSSILVISGIAYLITKRIFIALLTMMRFFYMPAQISFRYYDFFSRNPKLHFSETIFGRIFGASSPYDLPSQVIMAPNNKGFYNTGVLGDAYANYGLIAMLIYVILIAMILVFLSVLSNNASRPSVIVYLFSYYPFLWTDMSLLTSLLTGGGIITIIIIILYVLAKPFKYQNNSSAVTGYFDHNDQ